MTVVATLRVIPFLLDKVGACCARGQRLSLSGTLYFCHRIYLGYDYANDARSVLTSYTCGGVGHMSRDCGQGAKCYNCSGVVSTFWKGAFTLLMGLCAGTHQQGLPASPEKSLLHLRL